MSSTSIPVVAEVLAALAYGEKLGAARAEAAVELAPDARSRREQQHVAARERENHDLVHARLAEIGEERLMERFQPYFDAFPEEIRSITYGRPTLEDVFVHLTGRRFAAAEAGA